MPEYYQNVSLDLRNVDELDFGFYYDSKKHRYTISLNSGEEYLNVTRKEGEVILSFLKILREFISRADSKDFSSELRNQDGENPFDILETDPVLRNVRLPRKTESMM
ncbi:TPA_asm: hypothetical protein GacPV1_gp23 [Geoglobus acetivorans pleomorphic virus 1]|uniref:Uncharacterized protein n=2 Tax=root TaxID=1 RepID=A0A0A7GEL0_GEOAI|nr:hypothetical protein GACE_1446 [Geoglobus acetivorans]